MQFVLFYAIILALFVLGLIEILLLHWDTGVLITAFAALFITGGFIVAIETASQMRVNRAFDELLDLDSDN